jgi:anti-anti-sigma factor
MRLEIYPSGLYRILKITDRLISSQLEELRLLIEGYISQGETRIGICFSQASYLYSGAIAALVSCFKMLKDVNGDLCLLEIQPEMLELMHQMGIDNILPVYQTEDDLPGELAYIAEFKTRS